MDETNGPIFDHHDELFAQIGSADAEQELKDFVLEMTGSAMGSSSGGVGSAWGACPPRAPDPPAYPLLNNCIDGSLINTPLAHRGFFQPNDSVSYDMQSGAGQDGSSAAFLDSLVKNLPDDMLDGFNGYEAIKRSLMAIPDKPHSEHHSQIPASLLDTMHRISTDNGTQEYLDALSKPDGMEAKPQDHALWNGSVDHFNFQTTPVNKAPALPNSLSRSIDRNGNCPTVYSNGLSEGMKPIVSVDLRNHDVTKSRLGFTVDMLNHDMTLHKSNHQLNTLDVLNRELAHNKATLPLSTTDLLNRELAQSFLIKGLSPSVSAESGIHTPTTSYDSASPLSSGRTPLRSDDSISPLASCASPVANVRTPIRTDDCFSPGRVRRSDASPMVRTPIRYDETPSPRAISRTPLRVEDVPSPAMRTSIRGDDTPSPAMRTSLRSDDVSSPLVRMPASPIAPSPRSVPRTPLRPDEAPSPRAVPRTPLRTDDALSPRGITVSRTPLRTEDVPSPRSVSWTPLRSDEAPSPRTPNRTPLRNDEAPSPRAPSKTPVRSDEATSPRGINRTPLRPEDTVSPRAPGPSLLRTDESVSPRTVSHTPTRPDVSPLPPRAPFSPGTVRRRETDVGAGAAHPGLQAGPASANKTTAEDEPGPSGLSAPAKPRKRRKTDSLCVPTPKKRWSKKMPIYQSSVSGEESGIKLKIKLTAMPPPKRRRRRTGGEDTEEKPGKRRKRSPPSPAEQSGWGNQMPPHLLERIFKLVVDKEGCVPSLVRSVLFILFLSVSWKCVYTYYTVYTKTIPVSFQILLCVSPLELRGFEGGIVAERRSI